MLRNALSVQAGIKFAEAVALGDMSVLELANIAAGCAAQPFPFQQGPRRDMDESMQLWQALDLTCHVRP